MNQNILLAVAASVGLVAGAGGTYLATGPKVEAQAISKAELVAAIAADPSLCPISTVEAPTEAEATAAYAKLMRRLPSSGTETICRKFLWRSDNVTKPAQAQA